MISFRQQGDFSKLTRYLERVKQVAKISSLDKYGREGVAALASATPVDSGLTADSWKYEIQHTNGSAVISFHNTNVHNGVPIAIILQYGHGTCLLYTSLSRHRRKYFPECFLNGFYNAG